MCMCTKMITDSLTHSFIHSFILCATFREPIHWISMPHTTIRGSRCLWDACTRVSIAEEKKERKKERKDIREKKRNRKKNTREIDACFELSLFTKRERYHFSHSAVLKSTLQSIMFVCRTRTSKNARTNDSKLDARCSNLPILDESV